MSHTTKTVMTTVSSKRWRLARRRAVEPTWPTAPSRLAMRAPDQCRQRLQQTVDGLLG